MKIYKCDFCGKDFGEYELKELYQDLRVGDKKDICGSCLDKFHKEYDIEYKHINKYIIEKKREILGSLIK